MAVQLFGFEIARQKGEEKELETVKSPIPPSHDDGAMEVVAGGAYGTYVDLEGPPSVRASTVSKT